MTRRAIMNDVSDSTVVAGSAASSCSMCQVNCSRATARESASGNSADGDSRLGSSASSAVSHDPGHPGVGEAGGQRVVGEAGPHADIDRLGKRMPIGNPRVTGSAGL